MLFQEKGWPWKKIKIPKTKLGDEKSLSNKLDWLLLLGMVFHVYIGNDFII